MSVSKVEIVVEKTVQMASCYLINKGTPVVIKVIEGAGHACLNHPPLIVAGAVAAIAAKELGPRALSYLKPMTDSIVDVVEKHPKTTLLTTATMCSSFLPFAVTGEPLSVTAAGVSCTAAAISLAAYMLKEERKV